MRFIRIHQSFLEVYDIRTHAHTQTHTHIHTHTHTHTHTHKSVLAVYEIHSPLFSDSLE